MNATAEKSKYRPFTGDTHRWFRSRTPSNNQRVPRCWVCRVNQESEEDLNSTGICIACEVSPHPTDTGILHDEENTYYVIEIF